jgi:dTDP-4-amino-4,6-dideoxygalactose transaminase
MGRRLRLSANVAMNTPLPFLDLKAQYASIRQEINEAVAKTLESQYFILGPEVAEFE